MAWIELHQTLPRHPKLIRLASRLGIPRAQASGHLTFLWLWVLDYAPNGDLSSFGPEEIATAADFQGDPQQFLRSLMDTGWIDSNGHVHDWMDYAGKLVTEREHAKARMRTFRERKRQRSENVRVTCDERAGLPNSTVPNSTEEGVGEDARTTPQSPHQDIPTEPPPGFPPTATAAAAQAGAWGVTPALAERAWTLAASRGWRDARDVRIRSWPHYVAHCQGRERDREAEMALRRPVKAKPESKQIQESIRLPMLTP